MIQTKFSFADFCITWILFFSIVFQKLVPLGFILLLISLFIKRNNISVNELWLFIKKGPSFWFILYYFCILIGMFWSNNIGFGLSKLENKLTFLLFPIVFAYSIITISTSRVFYTLFFGVLTSLIISNVISYYYVSEMNPNIDWNIFEKISSSKTFSWNMHRSYFSCYCNILIIFFFNNLFTDQIKKEIKIFSIFGILVCSIGVIQSLSKINIIMLVLIFSFYFVYLIVKRLHFLEMILFASLFTIGLFLVANNNALAYRFSELKKSTSDIQLQNNNSLESSEIRLIMWNASLQVWKSNFIFGTGTGDYNDELKLYNTKQGNLGVVKEELNSHNQFLNTSVQLGLVGLLILLMIFLSAFLVYPKSIWQTAILIVIFANFLVESFIETQSGIVLFCVLLTFLFSRKEINTVVHNQ